jgi:iron(III) transport system ATP-binding protein
MVRPTRSHELGGSDHVAELQQISVVRGSTPALVGIDLLVDPGEVVVVTGPNGSGKSTLLQLCAGLLAPSAGWGRVLGVDLGGPGRLSLRARVGYLGHQLALYPELSAEENVVFLLRALGVERGLAWEAARLSLDAFGLTGELLRKPSGKLSNGQRKRVALASIFSRAPSLLLLDEPFSGLDESSREALWRMIAEATCKGAACMLASPDPPSPTALPTRTFELEAGHTKES